MYRSMEVKYGPRGGENGFDLEIVTFLCLSPEKINFYIFFTAPSSTVDGSSTGVTLCPGRYACLLLLVYVL